MSKVMVFAASRRPAESGRRKAVAVIRGLPATELKRRTWYWTLQCACGREILVNEDPTSGVGGDYIDLDRPAAVACTCATVTMVWRLWKLKTP
jgi:hypothetical protein